MPEMNNEKNLRAADRKAIALALPENSVLVEFVRVQVVNFKSIEKTRSLDFEASRYVAFVLPAGQPDSVQMIDLGEAEPITQMIATFRSLIPGQPENREARPLA